MKIFLVYPNNRVSSDGFRLLAALLRKDGHQLVIVNIPRNYSCDFTAEELQMLGDLSVHCDLVLMNVYSLHKYHAEVLTQYLKKLRPDRLVIWGGPHCINSPEISLKYADGVCYSEGDIAVPQFTRLLEAGDPSFLQTPNMAFQTGGEVTINPLIPLVDDLDSLPFSDYSFENEWVLDKSLLPLTPELFLKYCPPHPFKEATISHLSSRGCPHRCSYCNNIRYLRMYPHLKIRRQSVERLIAELTYMTNLLPDARYLLFSDDDFFIRPESEIEEFVSQYNRKIGLSCSFGVSATTLTSKKISHLLKLENPVFIQLGVQSGSQNVVNNVFDRSISIPKIKYAINEILPYIKTGKIKLLCDFIIDNPYETKSDIIETYKFIARLPGKVFVNLYLLSFFPGSPLYDRAMNDNLILLDDPYMVRSYQEREIRYQFNYETLLLLTWESIQFTRRMPYWVIMLPASKPVRFLMGLIPKPVLAWALRTIPPKLNKMIRLVLGVKNRKRILSRSQ